MVASELDRSNVTAVARPASVGAPIPIRYAQSRTACRVRERDELDITASTGNGLEGDGRQTSGDDAFRDWNGGHGLRGTGDRALRIGVEVQLDLKLCLGRKEVMEEEKKAEADGATH